MIREIENVFAKLQGYRCFGCDPTNDLGLRVRLFADDEKGEVFATIKPEERLSGFPGVLHGGIQCVLIDEVAFWAMFDRIKRIGVTVKIEMEFLNTVRISSHIEVRGKIDRIEGRDVFITVEILNNNNEVCTRGRVVYHIAKKETVFKVLGKERFIPEFLKYLED
ncbi:MAG: PaaI family thioesterase [Candidatus Dadabacteria bacterium]